MAVIPKVKEFTVIEQRDGDVLTFKTNVAQYLNNKWRINGNLIVTRIFITGSETFTYHQAMTRY